MNAKGSKINENKTDNNKSLAMLNAKNEMMSKELGEAKSGLYPKDSSNNAEYQFEK